MFTKDNGLLLLCGVLCSIMAWAFWYFAGEHGFSVLAAVVIVSLAIDNRRLRAKLATQRGVKNKEASRGDSPASG